MSEDLQKRLEECEKRIQALHTNGIHKPSAVLGIALFGAFLLFVVIYASFPGIEDGDRFRAGIGFGFIGLIVYIAAYKLVSFCLKAVVESMAAIILLVNVSVGAFVWPNWNMFADFFVELSLAENTDDATGITILCIATGILIFDVLAFLILIPMAKTVGTSIELD